MTLPIIAVIAGLLVLIWSADRFIDGASGIASHLGMPPLLIGILIVGFGTSAPELIVSGISAWQGNPGLALGNAFGSNIANIALILGITVLVCPIKVQSGILKKELPVLTGATILAIGLLLDLKIERWDGLVMLAVFTVVMGWSAWQGVKGEADPMALEFTQELDSKKQSIGNSILWLVIGLALLIGSSRAMVWGAVEIAQTLGVNDLVIGLTIVAIGTSLPELASSIAAAKKGEHDIVLGNIIGSNMFNTLAVVGIAALIRPFATVPEIMTRDLPVVAGLTLSLFILCYRPGGPGQINRKEGSLLLLVFAAYNGWLFFHH
ncbi:calcium/sodium antiporter [Pelagicoccus sp. SDUM812003]|uniref:calcium/sodium antiporter n=1 Tax=Pelagicoccus sp. SDUM812003 TaxID=3041267 RepID=UPI00280E759D|nr:calcium/sodium antiporter [Pelagicoccus sp. SDUM812003]MDQ8205238.1 calcium/sodium antiporter [Pelagicoccus sp. SDUM812003]